jgi:ElaA protein
VGDVTWRSSEFGALDRAQLYGLMRLRQEVFVVEQNCPYLDADGLDPFAVHVYAVDNTGAGKLMACARWFAPGVRADEAVIGRVATAREVRGMGLGRELMRRAIESVEQRHPRACIRIGAQSYLERFYGSFGFVRDGADYLEDGIPHLPMLRPNGCPAP